ncbi:MAG TPA: hypothetical protein VI564_08360 [Candidatus Nanoarchaeia archaeon]|nr:hypothetical protein [Candidatus Nanoarchaeia archaeon]
MIWRFVFLSAVILLFLCHPVLPKTPQCDYEARNLLGGSVFGENNFSFSAVVLKNFGEKNLISGEINIVKNGEAVKTYYPWKSKEVSKQSTSPKYSPKLEKGEYELNLRISPECDDQKPENNFDSEKFVVTGPKKSEFIENESYGTKPAEDYTGKNEAYESGSYQSKNIVIYLLAVLSVIINFVLIIKR